MREESDERQDSGWCPQVYRYQRLPSCDFLRVFQEFSSDRTWIFLKAFSSGMGSSFTVNSVTDTHEAPGASGGGGECPTQWPKIGSAFLSRRGQAMLPVPGSGPSRDRCSRGPALKCAGVLTSPKRRSGNPLEMLVFFLTKTYTLKKKIKLDTPWETKKSSQSAFKVRSRDGGERVGSSW